MYCLAAGGLLWQSTEDPDRMLAVIAGDRDELIQDALLVRPAA